MKALPTLTQLIDSFRTDPDSPHRPAAQKAIQLAAVLQQQAVQLQTPDEKRQQLELERMMDNPKDKSTMTYITDQAFRSEKPHRAADQLIHILDIQGIPRFFSALDRTLLKGFQSFGGYLPGVSLPLVKEKMRGETANVILPAEKDLLSKHLKARREQGLRMNVNFLGEALLGEDEARNRLKKYLQALQYPEIEVMSVKISTLYSQITPIAREATIQTLCDRMELLYRAAAKMRYTRHDGEVLPKFVYLDMEEYRDMTITEEVFIRTLSRPGMENVQAGIALQAYIPDSFQVQERLTAWARERVAAGGAPVTIRIVKGANMEMEQVESSLFGWPQPPYNQKVDTDANYKRMLEFGLEPENSVAIRIGIASHNLFDVAYGLILSHERGVIDQVQFEMLEGMANHQRRAICELDPNMLLYAPATRREDFIHAIGYLVRRLDENTGPENFLRHTFKLEVGSEEWENLEGGFLAAFDRIPTLPAAPRRTQDRSAPIEAPDQALDLSVPFVNESDTDFALPHHAVWADGIREQWVGVMGEQALQVPLVIAGEEIFENRTKQDCSDPSRPGVVVAQAAMPEADDIDRALAAATDCTWSERSIEDRWGLLRKAAQELRMARGDLLGAAMAECAKLFTESDPEISEAIDFVEYYPRGVAELAKLEGISLKPRGPVLVVSPWNFPIAIPCGGIAAALAAGNPVIIKPSPDAVMVAWVMCQCFWRAGVPMDALQFLPTQNVEQASRLVSDDRIDSVILTGGTETARAILDKKPDLNLLAETGGKNCMIVTAMSDRELAVKNILHSAFGHSGQKCSATSLLILEEEVFHDEEFKELLRDATMSLKVGSAWDPSTKVVPVIRQPTAKLDQALKELEEGESWLLMPEHRENNSCLYSPGIKWDVKPGSFTHCTEFFGPVLGVMCAKNLSQAIQLANGTDFGLTSGLQSLDDREQEFWLERIEAGNLYINRETTGAIVHRQPFGGMKASSFGPGIKAGGPNYVSQFLHIETTGNVSGSDTIEHPDLAALAEQVEDDAIIAALRNYDLRFREEFASEHDDFKLVGQDNIRRYLPVKELRIRVCPGDSPFSIIARVAAARIAGSRITISLTGEIPDSVKDLERWTEHWAGGIEFVHESDEVLAKVIREQGTDRVRYAGKDQIPASIFAAANERGLCLVHQPVLSEGRIELLWYLNEQSISYSYHRYGNLGARSTERRASVL